LVVWALKLAAFISIVTTISIVVILIKESIPFFREIPIWDFLTGTTWTPNFNPASYGVLPLIGGTLLVAIIAGVTAVVFGLASAIFLSEYAPDKLRRVVKPILEILAGIPTVVYGFFALTFLSPQLQKIFPDMIVFNALSAGLVMGLMIMPMISTLSEDAMLAVPRSLRDGAYALGATKFEVAIKVVVPAALGGIVASFILALSRAIGETMIVTLAAGASPNLTFNPLESIQAMTAYIVQTTLGEAAHASIQFQTIFAVGMVLFIMTLAMNIVGRFVVARWSEKYE
jgi:phosphate transport system permease protein